MDPRNIQQVAWAALVAAFAAFLAIGVGVPWAGWRYLISASVAQEAVVECKRGAVQIDSGAANDSVSEDEGPRRISEGMVLQTVTGGEAMVSTFDDSAIHLGSQVRLNLERMRTGRFAFGTVSPQVVLGAAPANGHDAWLWIGTTEVTSGRDFQLRVPGDGRLHFAPASKACVWLRRDGAVDVLAAAGSITVSTGSAKVSLPAGQRAHLVAGGESPPVLSPQRMNVLQDGQLEAGSGAEQAWHYRFDPLGASGDEIDTRPAHFRQVEGRAVVRLSRANSGGRPADMVYEQALDYALSAGLCGNSEIEVTATLRVLNQTVPGGGTVSSEYPVRLKMTLEDDEGRQQAWTMGFYAVAPSPDNDPDGLYHVENGQLVPRGQWVAFSSGNLLDPANPNGFLQRNLRPARIVRFEIIASGHDYDSDVDDVGLWVK